MSTGRKDRAPRPRAPRTGLALLATLRLGVVALSIVTLVSMALGAGLSSVEDAANGATILTDENGRALYVTLDDSEGTSTCTGDCTANWQPLLVEGETTVAGDVDPTLVGSVTRDDGTEQVTYNGWPLYRYARDFNPNLRLGQGLGGVWYLVSVAGEPVGAPSASGGGAELSEEEVASLVSAGQQVFGQFCAACHGTTGRGGMGGPQLAGNTAVGDANHVLRQIVQGGSDMPAFGPFLSDEQVAAVATYVRRSWGNDHPAISAEEVSEYR